MKKLHLLTIACVLFFPVVTHAQAKDQFPQLQPVPGTGELIDNPTTHFTFGCCRGQSAVRWQDQTAQDAV